MQIRIRVCVLQVIWGVVVGGAIPKMGNCDFGGFDAFPEMAPTWRAMLSFLDSSFQ